MIDLVNRLITVLGYAAKIADADAGGMSATAGSVIYEVEVLEHHFHTYEHWFGLAGAPSGVHRADHISLDPVAFSVDAGNDTWSSWLQIVGSTDTPFIAGNVSYDLHRLSIISVERANATHFIQVGFGATGQAALDADTYTDIVFRPQTVQGAEAIVEMQMPRVAVGTLAWFRAWAVGQDTGTLGVYIGIHEYSA